MSDREKKELNNDDLSQIKSLIGDADPGQFSVDDILAEYGSGRHIRHQTAVPADPLTPESGLSDPGQAEASAGPRKTEDVDYGPDLPWPEAPRRVPKEDNVVSFPGGQALPEDDGEPETASAEEPDGESLSEEDGTSGDAEADPEGEEDSAEIIPFPEEESALTAFIKDLSHKADSYADGMFEADAANRKEVQRLEKLIPGTDQEKPPKKAPAPKKPKPKKEPVPPPPDDPPQELAQRYGKKLKGMHTRTVLVFLLTAAALFQLLVPALGFFWLPPLDQPVIQVWASVVLLILGMLLGSDVLKSSLSQAFHGKIGMDTLTSLACLATLGDGILLGLRSGADGRLPYTVVSLAGIFFLLHGTYHHKCGMRLSCRTAAASSAPYRVTLDEGKWNGLDTYTKWSGSTEGFGSQIQSEDGAQLIFHSICPALLTCDVVIALLTSLIVKKPEQLFWSLSAMFSVTAAFGGAVVYARPFHKVARRLAKSGAVLAGWPGIVSSRRGNRVLVTDHDLFPPGYVELNGYKVMKDFSAERVLAYTATLIRDSGSGLAPLFHDQLRAVGGLMRNADRLWCYEGGGLSANIRGDQVLVGSANFMLLRKISLPQGLNVKNAVFCAINDELAGIFALSYTLPDTVFPAMEELIEEKIGPVLATRDFNLIPAMLNQRFKLATDKMDFPPVERRRELSDPNQSHSDVLTALLCREGLFPFAETITAAKRLRFATRLGAILCCAGSVLGLLLGAYLTSVSAFTSLSPLNLLAYMLIWLAPNWFLSGWVHRF